VKQVIQSAAQTAPLPGASVIGVATYDQLLGPARHRFESHRSIAALLRDPLEPLTLERFLIYFSALGVGMTEPVEDWIRRASERCGELGLTELAAALKAHAKHEADHHLLMQADTRLLVERWNEKREPRLDAAVLLALAPTPGVIGYRELHEEVISGPAPYGQLAIEYEIEMLSVSYGPALIRRCTDIVGAEILHGLSFLEDHIALDAGHTHFNRLQLSRLLEQRPDFLSGLVAAGSAALDAYVVFLDDCFQLACQGAS
jgi:hypothetical protein